MCVQERPRACVTPVEISRSDPNGLLAPKRNTALSRKSVVCSLGRLQGGHCGQASSCLALVFLAAFLHVLRRVSTIIIVTNNPDGESFIGSHRNLRITLESIAIHNLDHPQILLRVTLRSTMPVRLCYRRFTITMCTSTIPTVFSYTASAPVGRAASTCFRAQSLWSVSRGRVQPLCLVI